MKSAINFLVVVLVFALSACGAAGASTDCTPAPRVYPRAAATDPFVIDRQTSPTDRAAAAVIACRGTTRDERVVVMLHRAASSGVVEIQVLSGAANDTERACMISALQAAETDVHGLAFTTLRIESRGGWTQSSGNRAPVTEADLDLPNVDPRDVARTCAQRGDDLCVVHAIARITEREHRDRLMLVRAQVHLGDAAEVRRILGEVPGEDLDEPDFAQYEAWLWRTEHGLPIGTVFESYSP